MPVPAFEEYEPAVDCPCPGCARQRRELAHRPAVRLGGPPAAHGARRALVLVTAAGVVLGGGTGAVGAAQSGGGLAGAAPAADTGPSVTPQGGTSGLHGRPHPGPAASPVSRADLPRTTRADIIQRAKLWAAEGIPYSMQKFWSDGYRQDCSGYISMVWGLASNEWTGSLQRFATRIDRKDLQPGDILLFHNAANPIKGSHVTIFAGWTDYRRTHYVAYEQTKPRTRRQVTPLAYWNNSDSYVAYRYNGLIPGDDGTSGSPGGAAEGVFPGAGMFGPGRSNQHVTELGRMLVARGASRFYRVGPGPRWGEADRRATQAFQLAQGWRGAEADGLPGAHTWRLLAQDRGRDVPAEPGAPRAAVPPFPGAGHFRPGQSNRHVEQLGRQLVKHGYGKHYRKGPTPRWGEADRRNVQDFQRAQGWRGAAADGYPGPETWRRLFR
ncbi:peptidoglycan-binding protein [Streptomyces sp. MUM 203J]|uniref:peptidoglycan-binding protein n=1 Tax=Streptomyces sp. MUM 203J TaxID=2791990 RepID=UPI001F04B0A3|nr:peptidoglycan-binding protein [Streptomyces sp. MUM 203J]MCH0540442.1 peptidoglycan-binding protein [Streptomyces sp. MUM 203J]